MDLSVQTDSLREDAGAWQETSYILGAASRAAGTLTLSVRDLSFIALDTPLSGRYEGIRATVQGLIGQGGSNLGTLADTMRKVADAYDSTDLTARDRFDGTWEPVQ